MARKRIINGSDDEAENEYSMKRKKDIDEKIRELNKEIQEVESGDHKDIKKLDELLTKEKEDKKLIAASEYQLRKEVAENMYNSLLLAADRIYANDLEEGKKKLTEELKSRIRQIEEGYSGIWQ